MNRPDVPRDSQGYPVNFTAPDVDMMQLAHAMAFIFVIDWRAGLLIMFEQNMLLSRRFPSHRENWTSWSTW